MPDSALLITVFAVVGLVGLNALSYYSKKWMLLPDVIWVLPVRRKVISNLIVVGNLGLVAVFSTLVVGFLQTGGNVGNVLNQLAWIVGGVALVWFILLSKIGERITHRLVRKFLLRYTELGRVTFEPLLQIGDSWSIAEHRIAHQFTENKIPLSHIAASANPGRVLAVRCRDGNYTLEPDADHQLAEGESVVLFTTNERQRQVFKLCAGDTKTRS